MMELLYPINSLFFYRLIFMAQLLLGETIYVFKLEKKPWFSLKAPLLVLSCFVFALIFPIPTSNVFYSMMMFFAFFLYTYFISFFLFKSDWRMLLFCLICGYTTEHIAYEVYSALNNFIVVGDLANGGLYDYSELHLFNGSVDISLYFASFVNVYWLTFVSLGRRIESDKLFDKSEGFSVLIIGVFFVVIDIVINSTIQYYASIHFERIYLGFAAIINALACIMGILFIFEMYYRNNLKKEIIIINELRKQERKQYIISKQTIDMINIKCHDFRHQIRELGKKENVSETAIQDISKAIRIYDSSVKTNNESLNVILSEKSLLCSKYEITFSCIANGQLLSFISEEDIYSLLGNILDNAIEAVKSLPKDKKTINLRIKAVGNLISVVESNCYQGKIEMTDDLPKSTKNDPVHHGYGLKSIKILCEKYQGTLSVLAKDGVFTITILFANDKKHIIRD